CLSGFPDRRLSWVASHSSASWVADGRRGSASSATGRVRRWTGSAIRLACRGPSTRFSGSSSAAHAPRAGDGRRSATRLASAGNRRGSATRAPHEPTGATSAARRRRATQQLALRVLLTPLVQQLRLARCFRYLYFLLRLVLVEPLRG